MVEKQTAQHHQAALKWVLATWDQTLGLSELQHRRLERLLAQETRPPKRFGEEDYFGMLLQLSRLPEGKFKRDLEGGAMGEVTPQLAEARRREPMLERDGYVPENKVVRAPRRSIRPMKSRNESKDKTAMSERTWARNKQGLQGSAPAGFRLIGVASGAIALFATALAAILVVPAQAQMPAPRFGEVVPRDVREMYDRGLQYLAATQGEKVTGQAAAVRIRGCRKRARDDRDGTHGVPGQRRRSQFRAL